VLSAACTEEATGDVRGKMASLHNSRLAVKALTVNAVLYARYADNRRLTL
jgi:hypothetical protein